MREGLFNGYKVKLVETLLDLDEIRKSLYPSIRVGFDTETTGLDYVNDRIVGFCVATGPSYSPKDYVGYYIPVRHRVGTNLPLEPVLDLMRKILYEYKTIFWNRSYDFFMLENEGIEVPLRGGHWDGQVMAHLVFNDKFPKLKEWSRTFLKWDMINYSENEAEEGNFGATDPSVSFIYAAGDPVATCILSLKLWKDYPYIRNIFALDNMAGEAVRRISKSEMFLDIAFIRSERDKTRKELRETQQAIYSLVGYPFNINSPMQLSDALSRFVTLTVRNKSGKGFKLDKSVLALMLDGIEDKASDAAKFLTLLLKHSHLATMLSSFLEKMSDFMPPVRANYSAVNVASGRLSSGAPKNKSGKAVNTYYKPFNIQNIPKIEIFKYVHRDPTVGYCLTMEEEGALGVAKTKGGLREAFIAPSDDMGDWVWISADYSGQEICLSANFSKEPNFINPILSGNDLHMYVAKQMFGYEDPAHRTKVKTLNFACLYGATAPTIANRLNIPLKDAQELLDHYNSTMSRLTAWKLEVVKQAKRTGFAHTFFGRPVYVRKYLNSPDRGMQKYGERLAVNATIQGCLPDSMYVEDQGDGYLHAMVDYIGKRVLYTEPDGVRHYGIPTYRGRSMLHFVIFNTGDFVVCSGNHKFVEYNSPDKVLLSIDDAIRKPVQLVNVKGKRKSWWRGLLKKRETLYDIGSWVKLGRKVEANSDSISCSLFLSWLFRKTYSTNSMLTANAVRSICDFYGYNLVYVFTKTSNDGTQYFRLQRKRRRSARVVYATELGIVEEAVSPNMISGYQAYPLSGFIHKNTGGDLIRRALVTFEYLRDTDPEWRDNTRFQTTVHDEVNFLVRPSYLAKAKQTIDKVMNFFPPQFKVPVNVDVSVGRRGWGDCLDVYMIKENGHIIPKGVKWYDGCIPDEVLAWEAEHGKSAK